MELDQLAEQLQLQQVAQDDRDSSVDKPERPPRTNFINFKRYIRGLLNTKGKKRSLRRIASESVLVEQSRTRHDHQSRTKSDESRWSGGNEKLGIIKGISFVMWSN